MMRGGWLLSIYRENFVDNIRRRLKKREKKIGKGTKKLELVLTKKKRWPAPEWVALHTLAYY